MPTELADVGGKAAALIRLAEAGLPVPPGWVLCADFFRPWREQLAGLDPAAASALAPQLDFDVTQRQLLARLIDRLPGDAQARFAVRSSAADEDGADDSFAGIFETRLGVPAAGLAAAIRDCHAAAWRPQVQAYRQQRGLPVGGPRLALVIQQQLDSEIAGVGFSVNPLNNDHDEALFAASWGLGSSVVDGLVTPDHFLLCKPSGRLLERRLGDKRIERRLQAEGGVIERASPRAGQACLDQAQLAALLDLLRRVEALWAMPVDIEWAWQAGRLYLLQARPVTSCHTLPSQLQTAPGERRRLYLDASLSKGMTSNRAFSPLGQDQLELVFRGLLMHWLGALPPLERLDSPIVFAGGRMYLNLSDLLWLTTPAKLAAGHAPTDQLSAEILAAVDRQRYRSLQRPRWLNLQLFWRLPRMLWRLRGLAGHLLMGFFAPRWLQRRYAERIARLQADLLARRAEVREGRYGGSLRALTEQLSGRLAPDAPMLLAGLIAGQVEPRWALGGRRAQQHPQELAALKRGSGGNLVVEMGLALQDIARQLGPQAFDDIAALEAGLAQGSLAPEVHKAWQDFVSRFGWRGPDEMDIASPRYGDSPGLALRQMASLASVAEGQDLASCLQSAQQQRQQALTHLAGLLGPLRRWLLRRLALMVDGFAGCRDTPKYLNVLSNAIVRERALQLGAAWVAAGRLDRPEQVFALRLSDVDAAQSEPGLDLRALAAAQGGPIQRLNRPGRNFPPVIDSRGRMLSAAAKPAQAGQVRGMPIAPGRARGPVRRLSSADGARIAPGEILVAYTTDPGWTPLFINAAAVILEVGGALQHGALVAREFGKPCVAGVPRVMERWQDGDWVEVDGSAGMVSDCEPPTRA